jgi:3-hydroxyacyl-CoA dehydrogenase/enoyl-CoA hydratase/carnithine racemase
MAETQFKLRRVDAPQGPLALVTIDNGEDYTKPTFFGEPALRSLEQALAEIERQDWIALVLTGKPFVFAAGADIRQFTAEGLNRELAMAGSRAGHELFSRISALPYPTVAAINGACLGGGVEIALHCRARTISTAVRHFAAPEVFLGIIPAWGGTQLVPRLVGMEAAVRFNVENPLRQNRMLDGRKAFELGFADRLLEPVEFLDESISFALELAGGLELDRPEPDLSDAAEVIRKARSRVDDTVHGAAPAPYAALDLMEGAASWLPEEGYRREEEAVADLLLSPQAQASLYAFDLVEGRGKRETGLPAAEPRKVQRVGIVGAGLMASQLATLFLRRLEVPIVISDVSAEIVERAAGSIRDELRSQVAKGRYTDDKARFLGSIVTGTTDYADFADCDLVLEAVFEELTVKKEVFAALEAVVRDDCVLATNTSSLSVTEMGADLGHPERLVGMHFFNPVALMPLVELIRTPETDDETLATAADVARKLRKRAVLVKDAPGFVVNRILTRMTSVLMDAIDHGTPVDTTDEAILELGLPMAPSVLLQMVGPRVANHVLHTMNEAYPDRFPLSPTLDAIAEGRDEPAPSAGEPRTAEEVRTAALEAMADEIARLLEEGVAADARAVDTCLLLGAGFPFFLGGITKHLDQTGVSEKVAGRPLSAVGTGMISSSAAR